MKIHQVIESRDTCAVCGQTPCNCTHVTPAQLQEFVTPAVQAQDPGLEREPDVDVIFYGRLPQDWRAEDGWAALWEVLPQEYPPNGEEAQLKVAEVTKNGGAVVTTKPLSVAKKLVQTFNTYGIKSRINQGMEEGSKKPEPPEADYGADYQDMVDRVRKLAGLGPLKTVYDPKKRVYRNVPRAEQPPK